MGRKVIQLNPTTLAMTLPKKWAVKHGIVKGDEIEVQPDTWGNLSVKTGKQPSHATEIFLSTKGIQPEGSKRNKEYATRTILINALRKGYHTIKVTVDDPSLIMTVNEIVGEVLGYEIVSQEEDSCTIQYLAKVVDSDIHQYFIKFQHNIRHGFRLSAEAIKQNERNPEEIELNLSILEKNYNTFCRLIMEDSKITISERICLYAAIDHLYQGGRNMYYAYKEFEKVKGLVKKPIVDFAHSVLSFLDVVLTFASKKDLGSINLIESMKNKITYHESNRLLVDHRKESPMIMQLSFAARRVWDFVAPFIGSFI